ncbi:MAG: ABC-F family ATP-binding cassette domain-containing protein [Bacilli bacterium]|nr:ABC-F family ATP-binding cassette domain-containing protein [Bacilli bacterium]
MLKVKDVTLRFGKRTLFEDVNLEFNSDNCYGIIGANGAGKSTFLKILTGEIETTKGEIIKNKHDRISVLKQNHNAYDEYSVIETVIMGNEKLYSIMKEKEALYMKPDFSDEDGIKVGKLEAEFEALNGWEAESEAAILLSGLGIPNEVFDNQMSTLKEKDKVKILLASALFGNPDILLLDEPTNGLDIKSKMWLEEFLIGFKGTVILVSHDRHFLNSVCTYMVDIDRERIKLSIGNYDFWYESNELMQKQINDSNKKKEEKIKELQAFIARFSANASKSKQATSRKKLLEKIELEQLKPSSRKYPYINFEYERRLGKEIIHLSKINVTIDGKQILKDFSLTVRNEDKIALIGENEIAKTTLFKVLTGEITPDSGEIKIGSTVIFSYFPKNHNEYFKTNDSLVDFLRKYSENKDDSFVRGFLGRMLFSGEEALKSLNVLSGGEKVRIMFSKMMMNKGNVLLLDEPTNHLDIESITSLNKAMNKFDGPIIFATYDTELIEQVSNRLVYIDMDGTYLDKQMNYEEFVNKYNKI